MGGVALLLLAVVPAWGVVELATPRRVWPIAVPPTEPESVRLAALDLRRDVERIVGRAPAATHEAGGRPCVLILSAEHSGALMEQLAPEAYRKLRGRWEAYLVQAAPNGLLVAGSDERGAVFGVYAFAERYLGVDPMHFWSGRAPARRPILRWEDVRIEEGEPAFRYRGWFINDEDLLTEWRDGGGRRFLEYPYYHQVVHPEVMAQVLEAALRLQFNLIIPASFNDISNPAEERLISAAARRGLHVSMHHVEPMGVSAFAFANYWSRKGTAVPFVYHSRKEAFEEVWRHFARRWAAYPGVIWQLGLRGIGDRPAWHHDPDAPRSDAARAAMISEAMARQWAIIREIDRRPDPPATTTLWMEGAEFNRQGLLQIPPAVTVVFADNTPGWKMQADFYQTRRDPGRTYGLYYHHAVWGWGPHLVQAVPPWKTYEILKEAMAMRTSHYALFNVSNVREFVLGLDATARMTRDPVSFDPHAWMRKWCEERFPTAVREAEQAYRAFFDAYRIDERVGTPALLDGLTLHEGERLIEQILKREGKAAEPPKGRAASLGRFMPNMRAVGSWPVGELIARVRDQRVRMEKAETLATAVAGRLGGQEREFFENNLVAQVRLMTGLLAWTESVALAHQAREDNPEAAAGHLQRALEAFGKIRAAQSLASRGAWKNWYRGDRKMNLNRAESQTRESLALLLKEL